MRVLLYIGIIFTAASCSRPTSLLHTGDLLFQAGELSPMSDAITDATGKDLAINFSHVGIVLSTDKADSVLEASTEGGVHTVALDEFLNRSAKIGGRPAAIAMRLRDTSGVAKAVARAKKHLGQPYDYNYRPANGRMYCSELIWESYLTPDGSHIFAARPMNFRGTDGTMPQFWIDLFQKLGEPVPEGVPGTNPNDMSRESSLEVVHRYF